MSHDTARRIFYTLVVIVVCIVFPLAVAGCAHQDAGASDGHTWQSELEATFNQTCGEKKIKTLAMATEKYGYGSHTDYWIVVCEPGGPGDAHLIDMQ